MSDREIMDATGLNGDDLDDCLNKLRNSGYIVAAKDATLLDSAGREFAEDGGYKDYKQASGINFIGVNYGTAIQDSDLRESPISNKVTAHPNKNESAIKTKSWYETTIAKFIFTVLSAVLAGLIIYWLTTKKG